MTTQSVYRLYDIQNLCKLFNYILVIMYDCAGEPGDKIQNIF